MKYYNKSKLLYILILLSVFFIVISYSNQSSIKPKQNLENITYQRNESIITCFTPEEKCGDLIAKEIRHSNKNIKIQAFAFTSLKIYEALDLAISQGTKVEIVVDKSNITDKHSIIYKLHNLGASIYIDPSKGIAHNKIIIIDDSKVISGSFNFTKAAETRNVENVIIINNKKAVSKYIKHYYNRKSLSIKYNKKLLKNIKRKY